MQKKTTGDSIYIQYTLGLNLVYYFSFHRDRIQLGAQLLKSNRNQVRAKGSRKERKKERKKERTGQRGSERFFLGKGGGT